MKGVNWFTRVFAYKILERELCARLADKDAEILHLTIEVQELRDRLYLRHGMPPSGERVTGKPGQVLPAYRTGRQRLRDMVTPPLVSEIQLSAEEQRILEESVTQ